MISIKVLPCDTLVHPPLQHGNQFGNREYQNKVHAGRNDIGFHINVPDACHIAAAEHDFVDTAHAQHAGLFDDRDKLVGDGGQDVAHCLRQNDVPHRLALAHTNTARGLHLAGIHRTDAAADDLGHIRAGVHAHGDHAPEKRVELGGLQFPAHTKRTVIDDHNLHEQRRGAHNIDVQAANALHNSQAAHFAKGKQQPQQRAHQHGKKRDVQGGFQAVKEKFMVSFKDLNQPCKREKATQNDSSCPAVPVFLGSKTQGKLGMVFPCVLILQCFWQVSQGPFLPPVLLLPQTTCQGRRCLCTS
ncbi:hypothetical protein SDC9_130010 [bioreactor metagenome]|uniref:Uncharacterized protein n=1 Tax=bioreactor metagenome TaxID=1076179 RepID=A0A645D1F9_9ZZZZ